MQLITFTSDFGTKDYYSGKVKGSLYSYNDNINVVDITHDIPPYDIVQASFVVRNMYHSFPPGTIHLVAVDVRYEQEIRYLLVESNAHYFILPDNGLLDLILEDQEKKIVELYVQEEAKVAANTVFSLAISELRDGNSIDEIGCPVENYLQKISIKPVVSSDYIRASVLHIDNFGNVFVNITEKAFLKYRKNRSFKINYRKMDSITSISRGYTDVGPGELLCFFNSSGLLEISVNKGEAATLHSFKEGEIVLIRFINED